MPPLPSLLIATLACAVVVSVRQRWSPLTSALWLWVVVAAIAWMNPMNLYPVSASGAAIIGVGVAATALPGFRRSRLPQRVQEGHSGVTFARLVIATALVLPAVMVGVLAFRSQVSAAAGMGFGQLSMEQVRAAQAGAAQGGGFAALLAAANPILACIGVYGAARFSRIWWLLVVLGLWASLQTPARLTTISLILQVVVFYAYLRPPGVSRAPRRRSAKLALALGASAGLVFFNYVGTRLGKNAVAAAYFPAYPWPDWTLSPVLYFTGGLSALSRTMSAHVDPFDHPTSVFFLVRAWATVFPHTHVPETLADFTPIPVPFNVYTGYGQIWFDFGFLGVITLGLLIGALAVFAHARARRGAVEWAWVSAVVSTLLLSMPQAYRLFYLDVVFQLVVGWVIFVLVRRARKRVGDAQRDLERYARSPDSC